MSYGNEFRKEFLEQNPDKYIEINDFVGTGYGTHKYRCTWKGDWTVEQLVNYVDGSTGNYGGRIENKWKTEDGTYKGTVCVYYD